MNALAKRHRLIAFCYLAIAELLVFGPIVNRVGFYLDDWVTIARLRFAPSDVIGKITNGMTDPRMVIRPIEAVHYGLLWSIVGSRPLWYHLLNGAMEVVAAFLLYLCVYEAFNRRLLAFACAAVFLLYPIHDSTHYWVLASSATLSMVMYLFSLLCSIIGSRNSNWQWNTLGVLSFTVMLFNYECYLPLAALNVVAFVFCGKRTVDAAQKSRTFTEIIKAAIPDSLAYGASIAVYAVWSRVIVPKLVPAWVHAAKPSVDLEVTALKRGLSVSILPEAWSFFTRECAVAATAIDPVTVVSLIALSLVTAVAAWMLAKNEQQQSVKSAGALMLLGLAIIVVSYTLFGLNAEYEPTLLTIVNRINYGAAIGASIIVAAASMLIARTPQTKLLQVGALTLLMAFFGLTNWALAQPWILSQTMQRHVAQVLKQNASRIANNQSILLVDCPRYLRWSPVFDGMWDFQGLSRVTLGRAHQKADVISERLTFNGSEVIDTSSGFVCGRFDTKNAVALIAPRASVVDVHGPAELLDIVARNGTDFGLDKNVLAGWLKRNVATTPAVRMY